jgi:hypothetical protein
MPQIDTSSAISHDSSIDSQIAPPFIRGILNFPESDLGAADEYLRGEHRAAWYFEHRRGAKSVVAGVRTKANLIFDLDGVAVVLPENSMLMRRANSQVFGVFPQELADSYSRCFSDGTALCRLSDGDLEQALALNTANRELREEITSIEMTPLMKTLLKGKYVKCSLKKAKSRETDLTAHIQDLARNSPGSQFLN